MLEVPKSSHNGSSNNNIATRPISENSDDDVT
jgi:hypothetical protein